MKQPAVIAVNRQPICIAEVSIFPGMITTTNVREVGSRHARPVYNGTTPDKFSLSNMDKPGLNVGDHITLVFQDKSAKAGIISCRTEDRFDGIFTD